MQLTINHSGSRLSLMRMRMRTAYQSLLVAILFGMSCMVNADDALSQELKFLKDYFNHGDISTMQKTQIKLRVQKIKWSGINDVELFDKIETLLLASTDETSAEAKAWLLQALAFSGHEKYRPTISKFVNDTESKKVRRHASKSLDTLSKFSAWNAVIQANNAGLNRVQLDNQRMSNMIRSDDIELVRAGASRLYKLKDPQLAIYDEVAKKIEDNYLGTMSDSDTANAVAWLCKSLAISGDTKYRPLLEKVMNANVHRTVKKWARKSLQALSEG